MKVYNLGDIGITREVSELTEIVSRLRLEVTALLTEDVVAISV